MPLPPTWVIVLSAVVLATVLFTAYVEVSPTMGGVWIRSDAAGNTRITPSGLLHLMVAPVRYPYFWTVPRLWLINWPLIATLAALVGCCVYWGALAALEDHEIFPP
jgi:hypothetical protein